ncbi:hypothetical protein LRP30_21690 [Bradyrhizobium sp. C-145]|uniref:hypothetical protein n=1 Tax=Bradyrhizobium sp. C-145 TaxID=574727 RepID=UPI00201B6B6F|nr:hypothetical protein [Bradyrhizobium sp. C-145]UQR67703.1 hypothetical protein LRP30_21690 [Bradyrhizobium sp. C-145]
MTIIHLPPHAESTDSFPAQASIGQPGTGSRAGDSSKPAAGLSRRTALASLAMLPVALPAAAAATVDPIFAAIDAHRQAHAVHLAAIDEAARLEDLTGENWGDITEQPCQDENDAFDVLLRATATTVPGLLAKLTYLRAIAEGKEAWMLDEREGSALHLIVSFAESLQNIGVMA